MLHEGMDRFKWSGLSPLQLGRYAEYLVKMEFAKFRHSVFSAEVDDRGIDFVIRTPQGKHYDVQVKSCRNLNYVFCRKDKLPLAENLYLTLVPFSDDKEPDIYLIPTTQWHKPNNLFVDRDYRGRKSKPEYGLNLSKKTLSLLKPFEFSKMVKGLA